jgi:hypothetical protein
VSENELETAKRIASGDLPSPTYLPGFALVALRVSGTGLATRAALRERVFRDPNIWLSPETQARIAGLPVVIDHPNRSILSRVEYEARNVGAILFPYVADRSGIQNATGPDLWGIARVFLDPDQIAALPDLSTSPSVCFGKFDENQTITLDDGTRCLVEASPQLIDHVAIVTEGGGVWDRGRPAESGIRGDSNKESTSMTEQPARDIPDKRQDGYPGIEPDKLLSTLDAISKRLDALEKGKPADDEAKKRADAKRRRLDAENAAWLAEDPEQARLDDAAEEKERGDLVFAGEPEETAADRARESRRDRAAKRRADSFRDGRKPGEARRTAADAERERSEEGERADAQARCDAVAQLFGERSPPPMSGENTTAYRKRLLRRFQSHSPAFKDADLGAVADAATLSGMETIIYADAARASNLTDGLPEDVLIPIRRQTESGHQITEWRGRHTFILGLKRPNMRVTAFLLPQSGRAA